MIVGGYQISNILIAALLVSSVAGLGVSTDSFSGLSNSVSNILPSNSVNPGNQSTHNGTDNQRDSGQNTGGQDTDQNNQGSENNDSSSNSGSDGQNTGTDNGTGTGTPTDGNNTQDTSAEGSISILKPANAVNSQDFQFEASVTAVNASYTVFLNGAEKLSGSVDGEKTVSSQISVPGIGTYSLKMIVERNGEQILTASKSVTIDLESGTNTTDSDNTTGSGGTYSIKIWGPDSEIDSNNFTFDASLEAYNSSYKVLLNGVEVLSGNIDGSKRVKDVLDVSSSGEHTLTVQLLKEGEVQSNRQVSFTVQTTSTSTPLVNSMTIYSPESGNYTGNITFDATVDAGLADSYEIRNANTVFKSGSLTENSSNSIQTALDLPLGQHNLTLKAINSENGESELRSTQIEVNEEKFIRISSPSSTWSSNAIDFNFSLDDTMSGQYSIYIDGSKKYTTSLNSGLISYSKTLLVPNSGSHQAMIEVKNSTKTYTRSTSFDVSNSFDPELTTVSPLSGDVVLSSNFRFNTNYPTDYWLYLTVDGTQVKETELEGSSMRILSSISYGDHTAQATIEDEKNSDVNATTGILNFKYVDINQNSPSNNEVTSPINFDFDIETGTNTEAILKINGTTVAQKQLSQGGNSLTESVDRSPGTYEYHLYVRNTQTGKNASIGSTLRVY